MGWLKAILDLAANLFGWLKGRQDIANDPAIKQNKIAQAQEDEAGRIEKLVRTATSDPDPAKRAAAAAELRRMDSE